MKKITFVRHRNHYEKYKLQKHIRDWFRVNLFGLIALAIMTIIFLFSAQTGNESAALSNGLEHICAKIFGMNFLLHIVSIRKVAHFTLYAILGTCIFTYLRHKYYFESRAIYFILALVSTFIYACTDEFHQTFVAGRGGSFIDVLIDSAGCILALVINVVVISILEKRDRKILTEMLNK